MRFYHISALIALCALAQMAIGSPIASGEAKVAAEPAKASRVGDVAKSLFNTAKEVAETPEEERKGGLTRTLSTKIADQALDKGIALLPPQGKVAASILKTISPMVSDHIGGAADKLKNSFKNRFSGKGNKEQSQEDQKGEVGVETKKKEKKGKKSFLSKLLNRSSSKEESKPAEKVEKVEKVEEVEEAEASDLNETLAIKPRRSKKFKARRTKGAKKAAAITPDDLVAYEDVESEPLSDNDVEMADEEEQQASEKPEAEKRAAEVEGQTHEEPEHQAEVEKASAKEVEPMQEDQSHEGTEHEAESEHKEENHESQAKHASEKVAGKSSDAEKLEETTSEKAKEVDQAESERPIKKVKFEQEH